MARQLTTAKRVGIGFTLMMCVLLSAVTTTLWQTSRTRTVTHELINRSGPMSDASLRVINGVNYAVSQLRGWILLGDERFKTGRAAAWSDWIEPSIADLKRLIDESGTQTQRDQIKVIDDNLREMKEYQKQAESIARTDQNFPATELFTTQLIPKSDEVLSIIDSLIDEENKSAATAERKELLYRLAALRGTFNRAVSSVRDYLLVGDDAKRQAFEKHWKAHAGAFDDVNARAELFQGAQLQEWTRLKSARDGFESIAIKVFEIRRSDNWNVAVAMLRDKGTPLARLTRDTLSRFILDLEPVNKANRESLSAMTVLLIALEWILLAMGLAASVVLAIVIIRSVKDSIGSVQSSVVQIRTASQEIAAGAQQQVAGLNQTATSLNEITTTAEEFKVTMQEFADRARAVQEAAAETAKQSAEGRTLTQESTTRIEQVRVNSAAAGESVQRLAEQMQRIGEITATVHEIAEQTKMLALNASIEAARAGEEGLGFAVVATQVRELANQSKDAAGRIETLITGTQKSMHEVVAKIDEGGRLSEESTRIVKQMAGSFEEIAQAIKQTTDAMSQINVGARQQEQGITELVSSITEIDAASKESLASAEQTQKAILSIDAQINRLNLVMTEF